MCIKLLFDENLSYKLCQHLADIFPNAQHVSQLQSLQTNEQIEDIEIWQFAKQNNYTIVTQDADFNDISGLNGYPPYVIWIRVGNCKLKVIESVMRKNCLKIQTFIHEASCGIIEISS